MTAETARAESGQASQLQRYACLALAFAGALGVAYNYRKEPARGGLYVCLFGILTAQPKGPN